MTKSKSKLSLSEIAYEHIKDMILEGKIAPGDILNEGKLADELGMSRTPIREALRTLSSENWLEIKNGVGAFLKPLSTKDMEDLFEVRCLLEVRAAKTAFWEITKEEINDFEQRFRKVLKDYEEGSTWNLIDFSNLDWEFHALLVERCQNPYIKSIMKSINANIKRYQRLSFESLNNLKESTLQHLNLLDLLRKCDADTFSRALQQHLEWAETFLRRH